MKNNKEFLEGVYKKAEALERERVKKNRNYKKYGKISSMAAAIVIIIPLLLLKGQDQFPKDYIEIPKMARMFSIDDPMTNFYDADYIVIGETKKTGKSQYVKEGNYIYTDIAIGVDEVFLGDIQENIITLRVNGGIVKREKVFAGMEGEFKKGKRSLLFLQKQGDIYYLVNGSGSQFLEVGKDKFIDKEGKEYIIEDIKNNIDRR